MDLLYLRPVALEGILNHIAKILSGSAASPGPAPTAGSGPGTGPLPGFPGGAPAPAPSAGEVQIETEVLRKIEAGLPRASDMLDKVVQELVGLKVAEASYTSFTYSLAIAYSQTEAYTIQELKRRIEETNTAQEGVRYSADAWEAAEENSAPRWG
jgi:hypothetical protein